MKRLVVNADDFGLTRDVNRGIVEAHREGILTATTLMATGAAFDDAVSLAKQTPSLDVGCHLVLVGTPPFPASVPRLMRAVALGRIRIYEELTAQVRRMLDAGLQPSHLDTHKHTHLLPPVLAAVARISEEYRIPWVRRPFDFPMHPEAPGLAKRAVSRAFGMVRADGSERVLAEHGCCRSTDHLRRIPDHRPLRLRPRLAGLDSGSCRKSSDRVHVPSRILHRGTAVRRVPVSLRKAGNRNCAPSRRRRCALRSAMRAWNW